MGRRMSGLSVAITFLLESYQGAAQAHEGNRFQGDGHPSQLPSSFQVDLRGITDEFQATLTCPADMTKGMRWPLVIFTGGFGTESAQYTAFAENVASSGCAVLRYDVSGSMAADDLALVSTLRSLIDWIGSTGELRKLVSTESVVLAGHSRGAKLSCLAGVADARVKGFCLLDPVDNVIWTKGRSGFPSACRCSMTCKSLLPLLAQVLTVLVHHLKRTTNNSSKQLAVLHGCSHSQPLDMLSS